MTERAFIGLGSNLKGPASQILQAVTRISQIPSTRVEAVSSLYRSEPMGPADQPWYLNAVTCIRTGLAPEMLLRELQRIEIAMGRVRDRHWGPRVIDLDLLVMGEHSQNTDFLHLPHPGLSSRAFVLQPLSELSPDLVIPGLGAVTGLLEKLQSPPLEIL